MLKIVKSLKKIQLIDLQIVKDFICKYRMFSFKQTVAQACPQLEKY